MKSTLQSAPSDWKQLFARLRDKLIRNRANLNRYIFHGQIDSSQLGVGIDARQICAREPVSCLMIHDYWMFYVPFGHYLVLSCECN